MQPGNSYAFIHSSNILFTSSGQFIGKENTFWDLHFMNRYPTESSALEN